VFQLDIVLCDNDFEVIPIVPEPNRESLTVPSLRSVCSTAGVGPAKNELEFVKFYKSSALNKGPQPPLVWNGQPGIVWVRVQVLREP